MQKKGNKYGTHRKGKTKIAGISQIYRTDL